MWLATGVDIILSWQWALAFVAVTIIALFLRRPLLQSLLLLFSVFLLGGTLMTRQLESIGDGYAADETVFDAVVASQPVMKKKVMQMDLWITSVSEPIKVKASVFRDGRAEKLKPGDGIRAKAPL
jgi:competence protein ComEC